MTGSPKAIAPASFHEIYKKHSYGKDFQGKNRIM